MAKDKKKDKDKNKEKETKQLTRSQTIREAWKAAHSALEAGGDIVIPLTAPENLTVGTDWIVADFVYARELQRQANRQLDVAMANANRFGIDVESIAEELIQSLF